MHIVVTNDDGVDSIGIHVLARAMRAFGDVTIVAPRTEFSGASAAIGALHLGPPEVHRTTVDDIDAAWAIEGPPALCVYLADMGAFGPRPDLVVSGINPGANVGRSVYHSGTLGAVLTARNRGVSGVAVSQAIEGGPLADRDWHEVVAAQRWTTAADVGVAVVGALVANPPTGPIAVNVNVPNLDLHELKGWKRATVAEEAPRTNQVASLIQSPGHANTFRVELKWGDETELDPRSDIAIVRDGYAAVSVMSRLDDPGVEDLGAIAAALDDATAK